MIGVNIGVAAPVAFFPFSGWKDSFLGDLHAHGTDAVDFFTRKKTVTQPLVLERPGHRRLLRRDLTTRRSARAGLSPRRSGCRPCPTRCTITVFSTIDFAVAVPTPTGPPLAV